MSDGRRARRARERAERDTARDLYGRVGADAIEIVQRVSAGMKTSQNGTAIAAAHSWLRELAETRRSQLDRGSQDVASLSPILERGRDVLEALGA